MRPLVLDAGALIGVDRRDKRVLALLHEVFARHGSVQVPAGVVAQVWRGSPRQHALGRLLRAEALRVHALTEDLAYRVGSLLAASRTTDVVDAHVAILGRSLGALAVTSDSEDLARLDPGLQLVTV